MYATACLCLLYKPKQKQPCTYRVDCNIFSGGKKMARKMKTMDGNNAAAYA